MTQNHRNLENVEEWFSKLIDLDIKDQTKHLNKITQKNLLNDAELAMLRDLLEADKKSSVPEYAKTLTSFPEEDTEQNTIRLSKGFQIGAYSIIKPIGHGGMGTVYLAERNDGTFDQKVAIKVSNINIDETAQERFNNERQILAQLTHPHIAHLIDGGMTSNSQAFLIMEYVDGLSITDYCKKNRTDLKQRIRLIQQICKAVSAAHRQLVLHRDLKPDNILVNNEGQVKLLDFGIAKLVDENTPLQTATQVMTRNYASPEQIQSKPASTQSDLFSLAVVAFELITGHHPFPSRSLLEREQNVVSGKVLKITQRNTQEQAAHPELCDVPDAQILGDLENILLKALAPDPIKRYETVEALAQDLQNYLTNRTVMARKPSTAYSVYKWIQRHKAITALTVITTLTLIGSTVFSMVQAQKALEQKLLADNQRQLAVVEAEKSQQVAEFLKSLFKKAKPESSEKQLTAQDLLMQGFADIDNQEFISQETKFKLINLIHDSLKSMGKLNESKEIIDRHYEECVNSLTEKNLLCLEALLLKSSIEIAIKENDLSLKTLYQFESLATKHGIVDR